MSKHEDDLITDFYNGPDKVHMELRIWGFIIHLKQEAVDTLDLLLEELEERLSRGIKKGKLRTAIRVAIQVKKDRLQWVTLRTGNKGCKLVSPWPIPIALTVMKDKKPSDQHLYFSVFDPQTNTWSEEADFSGDEADDENDVQSASGPALAEFGGKLFCVHRGKDNDTHLYWETYTTDTGWSHPQGIGHQTNVSPALVVFHEKLYCFYRKGDGKICFCSFNSSSNSWSTEICNLDSPLNTDHAPAVAVLGEKLYVGHRGAGDKFMYISASDDLSTWTDWKQMNGNQTSDSFNLVSYTDLRLHTFFKDRDDNHLWYSSGTSEESPSWTRGARLTNTIGSWQGPALCFFETPGVPGGHVYMIHRSKDTAGKLYWSRYSNFDNNALNATPLHFSDNADEQHCTADNPALAVYHDPQGADPNEGYVDPANAGPRLICVYRGA
ncbi:MAG: hypothetical protein HEQ20_12505 [Aphanizomenon flos-aquae KM1D3_PB]|uniref:hypothetical protein n=1 Tax=Aphanizomenon flos-aquae TaxID=1176 RepID=UPI000542EE12|nr:hypothetical protein [Aphanizomenon flos-aquae]KHG39187.1 hypothetical protein OA07_25175 [Aphanizomenon flos-aquae 2012/KM1/D3]QSV71422.1 MAG: hypothetical protein HEQ20_12505 [Aphanizomenon flos-aquae KM1D3_PB]